MRYERYHGVEECTTATSELESTSSSAGRQHDRITSASGRDEITSTTRQLFAVGRNDDATAPFYRRGGSGV